MVEHWSFQIASLKKLLAGLQGIKLTGISLQAAFRLLSCFGLHPFLPFIEQAARCLFLSQELREKERPCDPPYVMGVCPAALLEQRKEVYKYNTKRVPSEMPFGSRISTAPL